MTGLPAVTFPWRSETAGHELVVVDVEGNGHQPPEIVEIALLPLTSDQPVSPQDLRLWLVRPTQSITGLVTAKVHGITNADVTDAPRWCEVRDGIAALVRGRVLVAHHAHVEGRVLGAHLPGWAPPAVLDTLRLAKHLWPGLPGGYGLDNLMNHLPPQRLDDTVDGPRRRHRAGFDAWTTAVLLHALLAEHRTRGDLDGDRLFAAGRLPDPTSDPTSAPTSASTRGVLDGPKDGLW